MIDNLILRLKQLHENNKHAEIIEIILETPETEINYEITGLLARAYNNIDELDKAIDCLMSVYEKGKNDAIWNFRLGYSYFYKDDYEKALELFEKSYVLGDAQSLEYIEDCRKILGIGKQQLKDDNSLKTEQNLPHSPPN